MNANNVLKMDFENRATREWATETLVRPRITIKYVKQVVTIMKLWFLAELTIAPLGNPVWRIDTIRNAVGWCGKTDTQHVVWTDTVRSDLQRTTWLWRVRIEDISIATTDKRHRNDDDDDDRTETRCARHDYTVQWYTDALRWTVNAITAEQRYHYSIG